MASVTSAEPQFRFRTGDQVIVRTARYRSGIGNGKGLWRGTVVGGIGHGVFTVRFPSHGGGTVCLNYYEHEIVSIACQAEVGL